MQVWKDTENCALVAFDEFQNSEFKTPEEKQTNNGKVFISKIVKSSHSEWGELGQWAPIHPVCTYFSKRCKVLLCSLGISDCSIHTSKTFE